MNGCTHLLRRKDASSCGNQELMFLVIVVGSRGEAKHLTVYLGLFFNKNINVTWIWKFKIPNEFLKKEFFLHMGLNSILRVHGKVSCGGICPLGFELSTQYLCSNFSEFI